MDCALAFQRIGWELMDGERGAVASRRNESTWMVFERGS